jgi:phage-related protein
VAKDLEQTIKFKADISDLKKGITESNAAIKLARSEYKAAGDGSKEWAASADGLTAKQKQLQDTLVAQQSKMEAYNNQLRLTEEHYGENSQEAVALRTSINNLQGEMNATEAELRRTDQALEDLENSEADAGEGAQDLARDVDQAGDSVNDLGDSGDTAGSKLKDGIVAGCKAAGVALAALATAAAAAFGVLVKKSFEAAGELEQNLGGSEAVFGEYAGAVQGIADEAFKNMGLSASDYLATANKMGSLFQGAGFDQSESLNMTSAAMQRAADVASIMGIDMESAMESVAGAAKGNYTMMDNLGVAMNETSLNAFALEKGLNKTTAEMTQQEKTALAMEMFLDKTSHAAGNYAKENETMAGSIQTAKAAMGNFLSGSGSPEDLAEALLNVGNVITGMAEDIIPGMIDGVVGVVDKLLPELSGMLDKVLPIVIDGITKLASAIVDNAPALINALVDAVMRMVDGILPILPNLITAGMEIIVNLIKGIASAAPTLIPKIVEAVMNMVQALIDNLPLLLDAGIQLLMGLLQGIIQAIPVLIQKLPEIIRSIIDFIMGAIPQLIQAGIDLLIALVQDLPTIINAIVEAIPQIIEALVTAFTNPDTLMQIIMAGVQLITSLITNLPTIIIEIVSAIPKIIAAIVSGIVSSVGQIAAAGFELLVSLIQKLPESISKIVTAVPEIVSKIVQGFKDKISDLITVGGDLIKGVWQGINDMGAWIWGKIKGFFGGIVDGIKNFFKIGSPSKLMAGIGEDVGEGYVVGLVNRLKEAQNEIEDQLSYDAGEIKADFSSQVGNVNTGRADNALLKAFEDLTAVLKDGLKLGNTININGLAIEPQSDIGRLLLDLAEQLRRKNRMGVYA